MITEQRRILKWSIFPRREELRPGWRTVYLQCPSRRWLPTHVRQSFTTYCLDLTISAEDQFRQYAQKLRQHIHRARRLGIRIERDQDPTAVIQLFRPIAQLKGLNPISEATFASKPSLLISRAVDPDHGVLAAHAYLLDPATGRVKGEYNASAFRRFPKGDPLRYRCGQANSLLYHEDFRYFREQGFQVYDFGGYGQGSVAYFKDRFHGTVERQYNYYPIWYFAWRQLRRRLRHIRL